MDTAKSRKYLKVVCIICMVVYALLAAVGVMILANVIPPEVYSEVFGVTELLQGPNAALHVTTLGAVVTASYGIRLLFLIPVLYGAKNPAKMMLGIMLCGILAALSCVNLIMTIVRGGEVNLALAQFVADFGFFAASIQVYRTR